MVAPQPFSPSGIFSSASGTDEKAPEALAARAERIELCDNLVVGGTSPSYGVIRAAVRLAAEHRVAAMAMVRPRGGAFSYAVFPDQARDFLGRREDPFYDVPVQTVSVSVEP